MPSPLLKDAGNVLADRLGARRTPEVFVLDDKRAVRYHGRIDDQFSVGLQHDKASRRDLAEAVAELLAGTSVSRPSTPLSGCLIARVRKIEPHGDITYTKHVASIFNRSCVECHRQGELAPFPLHYVTTKDQSLGWTPTRFAKPDSGKRQTCPPGSRIADQRSENSPIDCSLSDDQKTDLVQAC